MKKGIRGSGGFKVIRAEDPAIDWSAFSADEAGEFLTTRDADIVLKHPPIEGRAFTVFHCRPLTQPERRTVRSLADDDSKFERAFSLCVTKVENLFVDDGSDDGNRITWTRQHADATKAKPLPDDELDRFADTDVKHVGQVIMLASFCSPDRPLYVPLLDSCRDAMTAAGLSYKRPRAAQTKTSSSSPADSARAEAPSGETLAASSG